MGVVPRWIAIAVAASAIASSAGGWIEAPQDAKPVRLGKTNFLTSCSPRVERQFNHAVALLHSFWFSESIASFKRVLDGDPRCAMAHWGLGMNYWGLRRQPGALRAGAAAVAKADAAGATDREKNYISALEVLYADTARVNQRQRTLAYEKAMDGLRRKYPDDREAVIFHALAILDTVVPIDKTYTARLRAGAILENEFMAQPDHPGIAHYIIHAYDVPQLAARALEAARRYATIAPSSPHALHMPSHVFTRLGFWEDSIASNIASAKAAQKEGSPGEWLHALDYQMYAYLQTAQDHAASRILTQLPSLAGRDRPSADHEGSANFFAMAAIPARYALERHAWAEAFALEPHPTNLPYAEAITHFGRALGFARSGRAAAASKDIDALASIRDRLVKAKDAYWTEQVDIQRQVAVAWVALADGRSADAVALLRAAADREDATEKAATMPGPLMPARELLGDMLMELKQPDPALTEYESSNTKEPNRFWGVYGAARAAELLGQRDQARRYYQQLLTICRRADRPLRPELQKGESVVKASPAPRE